MSRAVKLGLIAVIVLGAVSLPLAYHQRHRIHRALHGLRHAFDRGGNAAAPDTLEMGGKKFTDVLGYPPYYLTVTQFNAVLFVTRVNDSGSNMIHVMELKGGQEELIPTSADFGRNIGATNGAIRDYLESTGPAEIIVASESRAGRPMKAIYHLNLANAKVDRREVYYYDANGGITNVQIGPGF